VQLDQNVKQTLEEGPKRIGLKVYQTFGTVNENSLPIFLLWAHTQPKSIYLDFLALSNKLFNRLPTIIIDDVAPRLVESRSPEEQEKITRNFKEFFDKQGCSSVVLSEVFDNDEFEKFTERIKIQRMIHALPKASLEKLKNGDIAAQTMHFKSNMYALLVGLRYGNVLLTNKKNIGIFFAFYEVYKKIKPGTPIGAVFCEQEDLQ